MIKLRQVSKQFGRQPVLKQVDLSIRAGEIFCLLGPSGAGKTTLIRLICGAIPVDSGEIIVDDVRMPSLSVIRSIGFMPQNDALYSDLTGLENLIFFGGLYHIKRKELKERCKDVLRLVGLSDEANKLVSNYSGGMKKRLSLAATLLHDPSILILDEPTVGIDPVLRRTIWEEFERLKAEGKTILVTTHVMDEVKNCERAGLLYGGHLIACGTVPELLAGTASGSLEELFINAKEALS
jgi:ABC-2 type transport system ATP-binding protein